MKWCHKGISLRITSKTNSRFGLKKFFKINKSQYLNYMHSQKLTYFSHQHNTALTPMLSLVLQTFLYPTYRHFLTPLQKTTFENIVTKGEIDHDEPFFLLPQCFQLYSIMVLSFNFFASMFPFLMWIRVLTEFEHILSKNRKSL